MRVTFGLVLLLRSGMWILMAIAATFLLEYDSMFNHVVLFATGIFIIKTII